MLVFGGTGDLALHKLLPALYHLHRARRLHGDTRILALARSQHSREAYQALAERHCRAQVARADFDNETWASFAARLDYFAMDASQSADFGRLGKRLGSDPERVRIYYLATAPDLFEDIATHLKVANLAGPKTRIVLENPSATRWNRPRRSTPPSARCSTSRGYSASTTTWARRRCRT
jgi:glucose-6-phosphate 1-dehydrogenase